MASRALAAAVHLACAFGAALYWVAGPAGHTTTTLPCGDRHAGAAAAATAPLLLLLLVSATYFLAVALVYLELAVAANPGHHQLVAARRLATATASAAAVTSLLALSVAVYGGLRHLEA